MLELKFAAGVDMNYYSVIEAQALVTTNETMKQRVNVDMKMKKSDCAKKSTARNACYYYSNDV